METPTHRAYELMAEIDNLQALLHDQVRAIVEAQEKNPTRWDYVGTLAHYKEALADLAGLNG